MAAVDHALAHALGVRAILLMEAEGHVALLLVTPLGLGARAEAVATSLARVQGLAAEEG